MSIIMVEIELYIMQQKYMNMSIYVPLKCAWMEIFQLHTANGIF